MDGWLVAAALLSAALHAGWNAAVKASAAPVQAMTAQMVASALLAAAALPFTGLPAPASWPWIAASALLSVGAVSALLKGYAQGGFGLVYPIGRASSVLLVLPLAALAAGEWPGRWGVAGVLCVSAAVALLGLGPLGAAGRKALGWALLAGAFTAGYIVCDAQGARRSGAPLAYGLAVSVVNALAWSWLRRRAGSPWAALAGQGVRVLPVAAASTLSYLLIVWVWAHAPIALGSALRDTSAVFAALIAVFVLKEPWHWRAGAAVALASLGSALIRFA